MPNLDRPEDAVFHSERTIPARLGVLLPMCDHSHGSLTTMRHLRAITIVAVAALGIAACSRSSASPNVNAGTTTPALARTTTSTAPGRVLHWTNEGPPLKVLAPYCVDGHCVYP